MSADLDPLTRGADSAATPAEGGQVSMPFPGGIEFYRIRMRQSEFALLCGVSRAAVTEWVKKGWITLELDGRVNPERAIRQLLTRADASRLRAKFIAGALDEVRELRRDRDEARAEAARARGEIASLRAERDDLAARVVDAEGAGDVMAERAFDLAEAIHTVLPLLTELPAAADALRAALGSDGGRE